MIRIVIVAAMALAALFCGGSSEPEPTPTAEATPTAVPTATPRPTSTPTRPPLTLTDICVEYFSDGIGIEGWMRNDSSSIVEPGTIEVWWKYNDGRREALDGGLHFDENVVLPGAQVHFQPLFSGSRELAERAQTDDGEPVLIVRRYHGFGEIIDVDWSKVSEVHRC